MSMIYKTIGITEKEQALAAFIKAQETDHMHFAINLERFQAIRDTYADKESDYYKRVVAEIPVIESRLREVENILATTYAQIDDDKLAAALAAAAPAPTSAPVD